MRTLALLLAAAASAVGGGTEGWEIHINEPTDDRWMYPANATPGFRPQASTFSALPMAGGVDDRFGQFVLRFDTATAGIPAGLGEESYVIDRLILRATIGQDRLFRYDPSEDPLDSYGPGAAPDPDPGRPMELHGTGFRGGFDRFSFVETSPHGGGTDGRNAYALGFDGEGSPRDVSNNVRQDFESRPWSIGRIPDLEPGEWVAADEVVEFEVDLSLPGVGEYVRRGLNEGFLWFTLSSLHPAIQQGGEFVVYYTKEDPIHGLFGDVAPTLEIRYRLPLRLLSFHRDPANGRVTLEWPGLPGFEDRVETSTSLAAEDWESIDSIRTDEAAVLQWSGASPSPTAFFRIRREAISE